MDVEWCLSGTFAYGVDGPGFDSHPGWHFLEELISLLSDTGLHSNITCFSCNIM